MTSETACSQKDLFPMVKVVGQPPLVLELRGIAVPPNKSRKDKLRKTDREIPPNYNIPSFKNSKMLVAKDFHGRPLESPFMITKPEFQAWMKKAVVSLESQLLSLCQITEGETLQGCSKLSLMLLRLPPDDSVTDLPAGSWVVEKVKPGEEGARITIERIR